MKNAWRARGVLCAVALAALAACAGGTSAGGPGTTAPATRAKARPAKQAKHVGPASRPERVDPRAGGFEVVLGEWAVTPEAPAIRPGPVTFVVHNRGTMGHGLEMEIEGDSSGPGSGDLFKAESELVRPGESTRLTVTLPPGRYEVECLVDGHDDMGMEGVLDVRRDAPLIAAADPERPGRIAIRDFAFDPPVATVAVDTVVAWRNGDPTDHTVTSPNGAFGSDALGAGETFSHRFSEPGVYEYRCAIHPEMKGKVKVE